jgi:hypothetical protein
MNWWFLLHDNAWPHVTHVTMEAVADIGGTPAEHARAHTHTLQSFHHM